MADAVGSSLSIRAIIANHPAFIKGIRFLSPEGFVKVREIGNRRQAGPEAGASGVEYFLQQLINGLTLGAIYGLIAIGYTMVYGIVGMINFAHGEIFMIGAFVALIVFTILGAFAFANPVVAILLVCSPSAPIGQIERFAYRRVFGSSSP
jgi:hypothetical protein